MRKNRPLTPFEFVVICLIVGLVVIVGLQIVLGRFVNRSSVAAQPLTAQLFPSATATATVTDTPRPTVTPLLKISPCESARLMRV